MCGQIREARPGIQKDACAPRCTRLRHNLNFVGWCERWLAGWNGETACVGR